MNDRRLTVAEYFNAIQREYLIADFKRKIYANSKDRSYYSKVANFKNEKITDISERNCLKSVLNDKDVLKEFRNLLFSESGAPLFYMNEIDLRNYYTIDCEFSYKGKICILKGCIDDEATMQILRLFNEPEALKLLKAEGITEEQIEKLYSYLQMNIEELIKLENKNDVLTQGIQELETLKQYINELELTKYVQFSPSLARGQNIIQEQYLKYM